MTEWVEVKIEIPEKESIIGTIEAHTVTRFHTKECIEREKQYKQDSKEFAAKYKSFCTFCGASGIVEWMENQSPLGSGLTWNMPMQDACEHCLGEGKCPLCGESIDEEAESHTCGWNWDNVDHDLAPWEPECYCWELPDYPLGNPYDEYSDLYELERMEQC